MGGGEFIPNGSMHWVIYEDDVTNQGGLNRKKRPDLRGEDPIDKTHIGRGKGAKDHPDKLLVTLRFLESAQATAALNEALTKIARNPTTGLWEVAVLLPVAVQTPAHTSQPAPNPFAQVAVDW